MGQAESDAVLTPAVTAAAALVELGNTLPRHGERLALPAESLTQVNATSKVRKGTQCFCYVNLKDGFGFTFFCFSQRFCFVMAANAERWLFAATRNRPTKSRRQRLPWLWAQLLGEIRSGFIRPKHGQVPRWQGRGFILVIWWPR